MFLQDACCEVPADWMDAGESDLYVSNVPAGCMREVVIHEQAMSSATLSPSARPAHSVYYHYFQATRARKGPSVRRKALLRAAANPDDADVEDTVQGTRTLTVKDFLRSELYNQTDKLQPSHFHFHETGGPCVLPAAMPAEVIPGPAKFPNKPPMPPKPHKPSQALPRPPMPSPTLDLQPTARAVGALPPAVALEALLSRKGPSRATKPLAGSTPGTKPSTRPDTVGDGNGGDSKGGGRRGGAEAEVRRCPTR
jgi:hypothetical protein